VAPEYRTQPATPPASKTTQPTASPASSLREVIKTASSLKERRKADEMIRTEDTREWAQNREFYKGNQYVFWNRVLNNLEALPVQDGEKPRYKVRLKQNKIRKGVHRWIAQMTKNKPVIFATPDSSSDRDMKAAETAEALFEDVWRKQNLTSVLQRGLLFAALSQGYLEITYDPFAGTQMRHIVDPKTKKPIDGPLAEMLLEEIQRQAEQTGIPRDQLEKHVVKYTQEGDICIKAVPGENVIIDPAAESFESAAYAIIKHTLTPDEIYARWKVRSTPDAVATSSQPALLYQKQTDKRPKTVRAVYCGYFRPTPSLMKGRYVVWIEGPDELLYEGDWPFPFNELPLVKLPGHESTEGPLDLPPTTEARPLQQELNRSISQVVEHKDLTLRPQMIAPVGSLRQRLTAEPGLVIEYTPIAGAVPEWRAIPSLPAYVFEHIKDTVQRIDEIYNSMPNQRDQMPARIDSGGAIDLIQESAADDMLPPIRRLEESLCRAGTLIAQLAQKFYSEPRLMSIKGPNGSMATRRFMAADLKGGFAFHAEAGSGLPRTRAGKQARIEFLLEQGLIDKTAALKYLDMADMGGVISQIELAEDMALREHDKLIQGQPISEVSVMQAMQMVSDPNADPDGDGIPDRQNNPGYYMRWAQNAVAQAAVAPVEWEDGEAHIRVHGHFMQTEEFESLPLEAQERFIQHYDASYQRVVQLRLMAPSEPPKINLRLQGATSAPVQGAILRKAGLQVSDDQVAMPPLDTWVTTDTSEPAQQASGDVQVDPQLQAMAQVQQIAHAEDKHQLDTAKAEHENALAATKVAQAGQSMQHAQEKHAVSLKAMLQKPKPAQTPAK
jgi:hypothetical protein